MKSEWIVSPNSDGKKFDLPREGGNYGFVSQYDRGDWYWAASRGDERVSGIVDTFDEATAAAERWLDASMEDFNTEVAQSLLDDIKNLERRLFSVAPNSALLIGYHEGFKAGEAAMRKRIEEALQ